MFIFPYPPGKSKISAIPNALVFLKLQKEVCNRAMSGGQGFWAEMSQQTVHNYEVIQVVCLPAFFMREKWVGK